MAHLASLPPKEAYVAHALVARLTGAITRSMKTAAWVARTLPELHVEELGDHVAGRAPLAGVDYLFLIAASLDGTEAEEWKAAARSAGVSRVILSLCREDAVTERCSKDWDAVFVNRGSDPNMPLTLFFGPQYVGFDHADLFGVLTGRTAFVSRLRVDQIGDGAEIGMKYGLGSAAAMIAHFSMTDPPADKPSHVPDRLSLCEIDVLYQRLAEQLPSGADYLLSVSTSAELMDGDAVDVFIAARRNTAERPR